jgi:hypothetical protein
MGGAGRLVVGGVRLDDVDRDTLLIIGRRWFRRLLRQARAGLGGQDRPPLLALSDAGGANELMGPV